VHQLLDSHSLDFAGLWPLRASAKICFACGGHEGVRSQCPGGRSLSLLTGARVLLSVFGRWAQLLACCLALELESNARQWQCGASCVAELVVGTQPRRPWHHRSPRGDPCVWPSTTSSCLQFVVRRSERVCGSSLCGIWPRVVRRLMWHTVRRGARAAPGGTTRF